MLEGARSAWLSWNAQAQRQLITSKHGSCQRKSALCNAVRSWEENPFWSTWVPRKELCRQKDSTTTQQTAQHATTMTTPSPPPSNGNEDLMKSTTTNDSSSIRLTLQVDNTSALPIFLQGRVSGEENGVKKT